MYSSDNLVYFNNKNLPIVYDCNYMTAAEDFFHADRKLPFHVLIYVVKGSIYVSEEISSNEPSSIIDYEVSPGSILFLKKGLHHFGKTCIQKNTVWYYVHFSSEAINEYPLFTFENNQIFSTADYFASKEQYFNCALHKQLFHVSPDLMDMFDQLVEKMHDLLPVNYLIAPALFQSILCYIANEPYAKKTPSIAESAYRLIQKNYCRKFDAEEIASELNISYKYLASLFKKEYKISMQQYHNNYRMQEAAKLLRTAYLSIGEISSRIGFDDQLYFSRCFKQVHGMSPKEFRRNLC